MADTVNFKSPSREQAAAERDRSYKVRLQPGDRIRANRDLLAAWHSEGFKEWKHVVVPAGTVLVQVGYDTNAGFRGIEAFAWHEVDGVRYSVIASTGAFTKVNA